MLHKLREFFSPPPPPRLPAVPEGRRYYAIGDIHGRLDLYEAMIAAIEQDMAGAPKLDHRIILLGDLVDRGPDSAGVIETALALKAARGDKLRLLAGNHEEIFIEACRTREPKLMRFFLKIGGDATLLSYPITRAEYRELSLDELADRLPTLVPEAHLEFLESFEDQIVIGDYVFVHAGIRPNVPLGEQKVSDMRWIREEFFGHKGAFEKVVIYGHTIYDGVEEQGSRIGIDTGAYATGQLTAIGLEGSDRWYLQTN